MSVYLGKNKVGITKYIKESKGDYFVKVIDYDGTILKEANLNTGDTFELPTPLSHAGLVFQEWSCSQEITDNKITVEDNNVMIGAVYTTASGLNEFDIVITKSMEADITTNGYVVTLYMDGTKDWGDGTSDDLTTHTYTNYGEYTIKCDGTTMTNSSSTGLFGQASTSNINYCVGARLAGINAISQNAFNRCRTLKMITIPKEVMRIGSYALGNCYSLTGVVIPNGILRLEDYSLYNCYSLVSVVIPNSVTYLAGQLFANDYVLENVVIPNSVTHVQGSAFGTCYNLQETIIPNSVQNIGGNVFGNCYSLKRVIIQEGVTNIYTNMFNSCYALHEIILPTSITNIGQGAFGGCRSLKNIKIPSGVTQISSNTFQACYSLTIYDFSTHNAVPTLADTAVFNNTNETKKIIVPDNLYDEWIVATNWATYANYIYKASEVQ